MYASGRNWERDEKDESPILQQYQNRCISNNRHLQKFVSQSQQGRQAD